MALADKLTGDAVARARGIDPVIVKWGVWWLFHRTKDMSWKFRVGPIPVSIKIAKLQPFIELWAGPDPGGTDLMGF